jgi:hypothetical protein
MKCPTCDGTGEIGNYEHDEDFRICPTCRGEGSIFDLSDPQPWDIDNPGWGRFDGHLQSKWKTRFVVSGCNKPSKIVEFMYQKTGIEYASLQFSESKTFPGENETYMIPCMYFFPAHERDFTANVTKAELTELYWY